MLVENAKGNFAFVRGIPPFSSGVVARPGFEIIHATFKPFAALAQASGEAPATQTTATNSAPADVR
jgi:hypothetical protein